MNTLLSWVYIPTSPDNLKVFNVAFIFIQCRYSCLYGMGPFWSAWNALKRPGTFMEKSSRAPIGFSALGHVSCSESFFIFFFFFSSTIVVVECSNYFTIVILSVLSWSRLSLYPYSVNIYRVYFVCPALGQGLVMKRTQMWSSHLRICK